MRGKTRDEGLRRGPAAQDHGKEGIGISILNKQDDEQGLQTDSTYPSLKAMNRQVPSEEERSGRGDETFDDNIIVLLLSGTVSLEVNNVPEPDVTAEGDAE